MINILIVDDEPEVIDVQERVVQRYFRSNDIEEHSIDTAPNGKKAIELLEQKEYHLLFLDYMMPISSGLDVLDHIRQTNKFDFKPYVCMVTAMGTQENLNIFKEKKASSYVLKPFNIKTINLMLDTYIKPIVEKSKKAIPAEDFVDFDEFEDFDEFMDFDDESEHETVSLSAQEQNIMDTNNKNHKKVSAQEFLKDFDELEYILEDVNEIDESLNDIIEYLDIQTFEDYKGEIYNTLNLYEIFLHSLLDFDQLAETLDYIKKLIEKIDLSVLDENKKNIVIEIIRAILKDTSAWKDSVFIKQNAVDVFYIGASNFNSYLQLKDLLQKSE